MFEGKAVAAAMLTIAASMASSAMSESKSADAQTERNGIIVFIGKADENDAEAQEFFALK